MVSHELPLALAFGVLGGVIALAIATGCSRLAGPRTGRVARAAPPVRDAQRREAALNAFDLSIVQLCPGGARLVGGEDGLGLCARALGLRPEADAAEVLASIRALDGGHAAAVDALAADGEACDFTARGPAGILRVVGRVAGEWAWLRLGLVDAEVVARPTAADLAALIDVLPDPAWLAGSDGVPVWTNRAWREAASFGPDDPSRAASLDRAVDAVVREAAALGQSREGLYWVGPARGRRALRVIACPLEGGPVAAWARDVTDLRDAVEAVRKEADDHALVLNHIGDALAIFGADQRLAFHNSAFAVLWDLEPAWLADRPSHGEWLDRLRQWRRLPETVDYGRFKADELAAHLRREATSETIWRLPSERTLRVIRLARQGGGLTLIFTDITPELRLKSQFNHLIQVQRATLDKLTDAVAVFAADGRLTLHNEAFESFWSIASGQLQRSPDFDAIVELCLPRVHDRQFWRDLKGRITDPDPIARAPTRGEVTTAERRTVAYISRPLPDGATLIGFSDITDTRRLETALAERETALAEAERLKRAFVASVSYELRTPLTTIIGYAELLERSLDGMSSRERGYVGAVRAAATHLARSIEDVLETAEIDAGEAVLDITDVDVGDLLRAASARRARDAEAAGVTVSLDLAADLGLIRGDVARLGRVVDHLLDNALRHSRPGGAITLAAGRSLGEVRLVARDDGRGFPFDVQAYIFDRYSSHNRGGPGLGLSLVKALVELHGGWVALESEPGAGAVFTCHLPEVAQASDARPLLL